MLENKLLSLWSIAKMKKFKLNDIVIVFGHNKDYFKKSEYIGIVTGFSQYGSYLVSTGGVTAHYFSEDDLQRLDVEPESLKPIIERLRDRSEVTIVSDNGIDIFFGVNGIKKVSIENHRHQEMEIPCFEFTINGIPSEPASVTMKCPIRTIKNYTRW